MNGNCYRCGDQPLKLHLDQTSRVAVPGLTNLLVRQVEYSCANCGEVIHIQQPQIYSESNLPNPPIPTQVDPESVERTRAHIWTFAGSPPRPMDLQYPSILVGGHLYPTFEGSVQDGTSIDKHGEPDLMAEFAEEYLRQFWILIPTGRLPNTLTEVMPPLLLLFTATELALKAYFVRSKTPPKRSHSLRALYEDLDFRHKLEIDRRFLESASNSALTASGIDNPTVQAILEIYSKTYGGASNVHMDSRYYAEPTGSLFHDENLLKSGTPYPIFLPQVVRALIDAYWVFFGS